MMSFGKKILFFLFIVLWIPVFTAGAQEAQTAAADAGEEDSDSIMTVEEAYLSSAEGVIIKELAQSGGRDGKQVALQYIEEALNNGRQSQEILDALEILAGEGMFTVARENGRITITLHETNNKYVIAVEDTGIGIAPEDQFRIFERFYRVDKSHSRQTGGTGLGLSIVKRVVLYHHGKIRLSSKLGVGSTFTISFYKNGTSLGVAFSNVKSSLHYYPTICLKNCSAVVRFAAQSSLRPFPAEASPIPPPAATASSQTAKRNIMALVLEPTRELAQQTCFVEKPR